MKKAIAKRWVKALRSGEYDQGFRSLTDGLGFCCLGVLCEISKLPYDQDRNYLPLHVREWAGMKSDCGSLPGGQALAFVNDMGAPFKKIADIIERHAEEL